MKIFLSYATQDRAIATAIHRVLLDQGHDVFFDREDLPSGEEFHGRIRRAIEQADLFVFLVSESAIDRGSYTLNELGIAEKNLRQPSGYLLPVLLQPVPIDRLPAFVTSVTLLDSPGNVVAAVADAVHRITLRRRRALLKKAGIVATGVAVLAAGIWLYLAMREAPTGIAGRDGAPLVLVPAGMFVMGDDETSPRREVYLDAFYIDRFEVTTGRYAKFLAATGAAHLPDGWDELDLERGDELPVAGVDWNDAVAYCRWAGRRLPTETEWEKAARGTDGRRFPWGNQTPMKDHANFHNLSPQAYDGGLDKVGSHPAGRSPYGADDLAGNVGEWTADWYAEEFRAGDLRNPEGPANGEGRVIRGGGRLEPAEHMASVRRMHGSPEVRAADIGFRCAQDVRQGGLGVWGWPVPYR